MNSGMPATDLDRNPGRASWILTAAALALLVLVVANVVLFSGNQELQRQAAGRQQFLQQTAQLDMLQRDIVNALANLAARNNDEQLRELLRSQGITVPASPAGTPGGRAGR